MKKSENYKALPSLSYSSSRSHKANALKDVNTSYSTGFNLHSLEGSPNLEMRTKLKNFVKIKNRFGTSLRASVSTAKPRYRSLNSQKMCDADLELKSVQTDLTSHSPNKSEEQDKVKYLKMLEAKLQEREDIIRKLERDNDNISIELIKLAQKKSYRLKTPKQNPLIYDNQWITKVNVEAESSSRDCMRALKVNKSFVVKTNVDLCVHLVGCTSAFIEE
eukprot:TRINITY_DN138_c0_g2_i1.p2 TRINITY_DN138_c0_g2~~TRINITY_DN138_c0_g2_i1.p2  ORF type:complete len:219 (-),score=40.26 TRINITY_DN138_c0_g2_i1:873-1529(-)